MPCDREELLSRYIDNDLSARETSEMRRHLSSCRDCQSACHEILQREKALQDVIQPVISSMSLRDKVMRRIVAERIRPESDENRTDTANRSSRSLYLAYALAFMLVATCGLLFYLTSIPEQKMVGKMDLVVIMGLGDESRFGKKMLKMRDTCYAQTSTIVPMQGEFAFFVNGTNAPPVLFSGSATIGVHFKSATWINGEGFFTTPSGLEFTLNIDSDRIIMKNAELSVSGTGSSCQTRLTRGVAKRVRGGVFEDLKIETRLGVTTAATASSVTEVSSDTASASHIELPASAESFQPVPLFPVPASHTPAASAASRSVDLVIPVEETQPVKNPFVGGPVHEQVGE